MNKSWIVNNNPTVEQEDEIGQIGVYTIAPLQAMYLIDR